MAIYKDSSESDSSSSSRSLTSDTTQGTSEDSDVRLAASSQAVQGLQSAETLLTPAALQRVKEGLAAARDRAVRHSIESALDRVLAIAEDRAKPWISSEVRRWVLRSLGHWIFNIQVEHPERIPDGPAIVAANHLSHVDPLLLLGELPTHPYYYVLGDGRTLYNHWWKRWILKLAGGVIPLDRWWKEEMAVIDAAQAGREDLAELAEAIQADVPSGSDLGTLRQIDHLIQSILAHNDGVLIFPEGRLSGAEGELYTPLKRGTVIYALRKGVPIVPVALIGTRDLYWGKPLTIRLGEPLHLSQSDRPKKQEIDAALKKLEESLINLLPRNYQEPEGPKPLRYFLNHMLW